MIGGPFGIKLDDHDALLSLRADDAAVPARARRAARAALPRAQDPRRRAVPSLSVTPARPAPHRPRGRRRRPARRRAAPQGAAVAGAPAQARVRRLLVQRRDAAGAAAGRAAARRWPSGSARRSPAGSATSSTRVDVAGPGFLNLFLADAWYARRAGGDPRRRRPPRRRRRGQARADQRRVRLRQPDRARCTSATPATPPTATPSRACWRFHGHDVHREFYANDAGSQIRKFGEALSAAGARRGAGGVPRRVHRRPGRPDPGRRRRATSSDGRARTGIELVREWTRRTLARFRVADFDTWFSERSLYEGSPTPIEHALEALEAQGATYHAEGALWLRSSDYGDDKDRVLVKSDGDLHLPRAGHRLPPEQARARLRAHDRRLGRRPPRLRAADEGGLRGARRRPGRARAADHAVRQPRARRPARVDVQARRRVHHARRPDRRDRRRRRALVPARALARHDDRGRPRRWPRASRADNPVYYVQYAHARIARHPRRARRAQPDPVADASRCEPAERALVKKLVAFPAEVAEAADRRAPHRIATYALDLARDFAGFYESARWSAPTQEPFRLALCDGTRAVDRAVARPARGRSTL